MRLSIIEQQLSSTKVFTEQIEKEASRFEKILSDQVSILYGQVALGQEYLNILYIQSKMYELFNLVCFSLAHFKTKSKNSLRETLMPKAQ